MRVKRRWCPAAGKVTVGLASHWPCVGDFSDLSAYGAQSLRNWDEHPNTPHGVWLILPYLTKPIHGWTLPMSPILIYTFVVLIPYSWVIVLTTINVRSTRLHNGLNLFHTATPDTTQTVLFCCVWRAVSIGNFSYTKGGRQASIAFSSYTGALWW